MHIPMRIPFPIDGLVDGTPSSAQPIRTSFSLSNVRPYDVSDEKIRGGQRPGTALAYTTQVGSSNPIIAMTQVVSTYIPPA